MRMNMLKANVFTVNYWINYVFVSLSSENKFHYEPNASAFYNVEYLTIQVLIFSGYKFSISVHIIQKYSR